ncbi:hypothetical protein CO112_03185 [Candidatus Dojkabacteria bacterium CG_4_9_14_3_um_filter_150_Dojkabacteria_WS6_41_13]|uniref:Four helix bundle protein n=1 Tax=Candidatus Dojkabacteria bacterium CG_4_10_14_0_2_um_filter_Dojkabacteria_WS6_41_15 TaxID=2014249 RepID=A0A2M7W246_9BACT|nr:MAG: hypothetical protein COX64_02320 [Candidatus Dojkabacteria bacterium CG_4_10_14_0_2_um_filter_Dojkabacteria_WS6_41_15]PJB22657.1 MAG: hypothetical protein CO112_03185 [Candidatus Dojkabacteria bacterium CG_4_9_14_3_um_filter_150_Dojkabacteria_WS6_41_13]
MEFKSVLRERSFRAGVSLLRILYEVQKVHCEYNLTNQLIRSATSIHANLQESRGSGSRRDFGAKIIISRKECFETISWLEFLRELSFIEILTANRYITEYTEILKMLNSTLRSLNR